VIAAFAWHRARIIHDRTADPDAAAAAPPD
jgi:hypothetical protein